jgi:hypothetical protein
MIQGSVKSVGVEVMRKRAQHDVEVARSAAQQMVEAFPAWPPPRPVEIAVEPISNRRRAQG